jgi:Uma2 family endonuclease
VPEYWIILGLEQQIEVYHTPHNGQSQQKQAVGLDATLVCASLAPVRIRVADLFQ